MGLQTRIGCDADSHTNVIHRLGLSQLAFLVVPMVGAFFIDIINVKVIKLYLALPFFGAS